MHEHTERLIRSARRFTWKGRSLRSVLNRAWRYRRRIEVRCSRLRWPARGWNWSLPESPSATWSFHELTSGEELFREGQTLRHCVATYAPRCQSGACVIVSLRRNMARCLTLEVDPVTGRIRQARGLSNRLPRPNEQRAMERWLKEVVRRVP